MDCKADGEGVADTRAEEVIDGFEVMVGFKVGETELEVGEEVGEAIGVESESDAEIVGVSGD